MSALVTLATDQTVVGSKNFDGVTRLRSIVRVRPLASGGVASVEFFHHPDEQFNEIGDIWRAGVSVEPNTQRCFVISPAWPADAPLLKFTSNGQLSLSTGCLFDAPTIRQNGSPLSDLYQAKSDMSSYVTTGTAQTIAGAKTFSATTNFAAVNATTVNATELQVNGSNISSTYATQTALSNKQNTLSNAATGTQLLPQSDHCQRGPMLPSR